MDLNQLKQDIKKARESSEKRNFKQTFDLIFALKGLDMKKPDHQIDVFVSLHHDRGKPVKVCALVGPELKENAKENADFVIDVDEFPIYAKDKKKSKKLAGEYDFFIAQANIMPQVAGAFGRVLGTRGKMPNPKVGCIVPPKANLKPLIEKLRKTVRVSAKTALMAQLFVGTEDMQDEVVADNILTIYNALIHALPGEKNNLKKIYLKMSMGKPVEVKP